MRLVRARRDRAKVGACEEKAQVRGEIVLEGRQHDRSMVRIKLRR